MALRSLSRCVLVAVAAAAISSSAKAEETCYTFDAFGQPNGDTQSLVLDSKGSNNGIPNQPYSEAGGPKIQATGGVNNGPAAWFNPWSDPAKETLNCIVTSSVVKTPKAITYSMWIKPAVTKGVSWMAINGNVKSLNLLLNGDGTLRFTINNPNTPYFSPQLVTLGDAKGHFVGMTADFATKTLKWYKDGVLVATVKDADWAAWPELPEGPTQFGMGGGNDGTVQYQGVMDNIYVSDKALSDAEMAALQSAAKPAPAAASQPAATAAPVGK